jgi:hypothetical protein
MTDTEADDPAVLKAQRFVAELRARVPTEPKGYEALTLALAGIFELDQRLAKHVRQLEAQVAELEGAQTTTMADVFRGGYMPNTQYNRGDFIVDRGALWLAMQVTDERPGSSSAWRLIMKSPK